PSPLPSLSVLCSVSRALRHLPSFPTRRSSDLGQADAPRGGGRPPTRRHPLRAGRDGGAHPPRPARLRRLLRARGGHARGAARRLDRKSTRLNSSHVKISYAVFCLKKKKAIRTQ